MLQEMLSLYTWKLIGRGEHIFSPASTGREEGEAGGKGGEASMSTAALSSTERGWWLEDLQRGGRAFPTPSPGRPCLEYSHWQPQNLHWALLPPNPTLVVGSPIFCHLAKMFEPTQKQVLKKEGETLLPAMMPSYSLCVLQIEPSLPLAPTPWLADRLVTPHPPVSLTRACDREPCSPRPPSLH